jgi:hypothetical protein
LPEDGYEWPGGFGAICFSLLRVCRFTISDEVFSQVFIGVWSNHIDDWFSFGSTNQAVHIYDRPFCIAEVIG